MRREVFVLLSSLLVANAEAFEEKPWLSQPIEMHFAPSYRYAFFKKVNGSTTPLDETFHENNLTLGYRICPTSSLEVGLEIEAAATTEHSLYFRSGGAQIRYQWLNDIPNDPISLVTGIAIRGVTGNALHDISTPYANTLNAELNISIGKEWTKLANWENRFWAYIAVGLANVGSPWNRYSLSYEKNFYGKHTLLISAVGDCGFGRKHYVPLTTFYGWSKIYYQSIDLLLGYRYKTDRWGSLQLSYERRVYAKDYPAGVNAFTLSYDLPFSPF